MKDKLAMNSGQQHYQTVLTPRCWKPVRRRKQSGWKQLLEKYQTRIDTTLAGVAIGLMFLTGIWMFLVQLAEYMG